MRYPKTIIIANRKWKIQKTKEHSSADFSYKTMTITLGTLKNSPREIFASFLHEIAEISAIERGIRSQKCTIQHQTSDFVFSASHEAFSYMMIDVATVLSDIMELR
jgi:hypothetical protein